MHSSASRKSERKLFEELPRKSRVDLVLRYADRLHDLARKMAAVRRLDMTDMLESVASDLDESANEIAMTTTSVIVLAKAASLISSAERLWRAADRFVTVH